MCSVTYLVMLTQQSSSLTVRMHHNSQKRIMPASSSGTSMTSLSHSRPKDILQHHFSSSVSSLHSCLRSTGGETLEHLSLISVIFNLSVSSVAHASTCQFCCISTASVSPSSSLRHICSSSRKIIWLYIFSSIINGDEAYWMNFSRVCACTRTNAFLYAAPSAKMDIFNQYNPQGGKSKRCQAENEMQKQSMGGKNNIWMGYLSSHNLRNSCDTSHKEDHKQLWRDTGASQATVTFFFLLFERGTKINILTLL